MSAQLSFVSSGRAAVTDRLVRAVGTVSTFVGRASSWFVLILTLVISFEVVSRYLFGHPHDWVFDTSYMLYGAVLLLSGAYTLAKDGHVRGDLLYGSLPARGQAGIDLVLYAVFFMPGVFALMAAGYSFAAESWAIRESSALTPNGPPIYPVKMLIPVAGALLLVQGATEMIRCAVCLASGFWPSRPADLEPADGTVARAAPGPTAEAPQ